jgi:hypothetical protein
MATIITDTVWHGNPRPIETYTTSVYEGQVASPYYKDGRDVPVYNHYNTPVPLADLAPAATVDVAGPAVLVEFTLDGLWPEFTALTILLTLTDTVVGNYDEVLFSPMLEGPVEAAAGVAATINEHPELTATSEGQKVIVSALVPVTAITITTLTVN